MLGTLGILCQSLLHTRTSGLPKCCSNNEVFGTFCPLGIGEWRTHPCSPEPWRQLPKLLFPWCSALGGLAELLTAAVLRVRSLGQWRTTLPLPAVEVFPFGSGAPGALQLKLLPGARAALPPTRSAEEFSLVLQTEMTWNTGSQCSAKEGMLFIPCGFLALLTHGRVGFVCTLSAGLFEALYTGTRVTAKRHSLNQCACTMLPGYNYFWLKQPKISN